MLKADWFKDDGEGQWAAHDDFVPHSERNKQPAAPAVDMNAIARAIAFANQGQRARGNQRVVPASKWAGKATGDADPLLDYRVEQPRYSGRAGAADFDRILQILQQTEDGPSSKRGGGMGGMMGAAMSK